MSTSKKHVLIAVQNLISHLELLEIPYKLFIQRIRKAKVIYIDETEITVDGVTYHLWTYAVMDGELTPSTQA